MQFPSRLPNDVAETINRWVLDAQADATIRARLDQLGMTPRALSRDEARRFVQQEIERWVGYVKAAGIEPQ